MHTFMMPDPRDADRELDVACDSEGPYMVTDDKRQVTFVQDLPADQQALLQTAYENEVERYWTSRNEG